MLTRYKRLVRSATRQLLPYAYQSMKHPTYSKETQKAILLLGDSVRYASLALAIQRLVLDRIERAFAELGVYRGETSAFMHRQAPNRRLYLFDTFEGFPDQNLEIAEDRRFHNSSQDIVKQAIGDLQNVYFRPGYFPATAAGLEDERFALVMLDFDLYRSAIDSFRFFYPRLVPGGFFFMHDFNSGESNYGISRAYAEYMADKPELIHEVPDRFGTAVFRKVP